MPQSPTSHRAPQSVKPISRVAAIKEYFGASLAELKDLTADDKAELGPLCATALGRPLKS
jgi:hypothetical protein